MEINKNEKILVYEEVKAEQEKIVEGQKDKLLKLITDLKKFNRANILFSNEQINSLNDLFGEVINLKEVGIKNYINKLHLVINAEKNFKETQLYKNSITNGKK